MPHDPLSETELDAARDTLATLRHHLNQVLFGQEPLIDQVLTCMLAGGHLLLEGLPGLGKTELVRALGALLRLDNKRIQFTPDLLPGDITGTPMLQDIDGERRFIFQKGPLFTHLVLADEINRASPKTQSALLEAMQEHQVTSMGQCHALPAPFFVLATQNPIDLEGTYPLPEAQLDRFLFKLNLEPGGADVLQEIVERRHLGQPVHVEPQLDAGSWRRLMEQTHHVHLAPIVAHYIARLVHATHKGASTAAQALHIGAGPRAAIGLAAAGRARALLHGRGTVGFEDIRAVTLPVLQHRIKLEYTAKLEGRTGAHICHDLLKEIPTTTDTLPPTLTETP